MRKRLFYDIETSFNVGVFWRTGYNLTINPGDIIHERAIICICYKWEGEDEIHSLTWSRFGDMAKWSKIQWLLCLGEKAWNRPIYMG